MGLDEEMIGCLCHVLDERIGKESFLLCVLSRDDFLLSDPSAISEGGGGVDLDKEALLVIDVGNAIVNYLVSCDEVDDELLRLIDFLSDGGTVEQVEVLVSLCVAACGAGKFLLEVAISIPNEELDVEDSDIGMMLLDRKLVLFSSSAGAILWTGDSTCIGETLSPRNENMAISCVRMIQPERRLHDCYFSVVSSTSITVLAGVIEPCGNVVSPQIMGTICRSTIQEEPEEEGGWRLRGVHQRPMVMTRSDVVVVDVFESEVEEEGIVLKSVISFVPIVHDGAAASTINIDNCEVFRLCLFSTEHIVALCRVQKKRRRVTEGRQPGGERQHDVDDESNSDIDLFDVSLDAIIIHVKSRQQLERVCLVDDWTDDMMLLYDVPVFLVSDGNTVGLGYGWKGVVLTGSDVRSTHLGRRSSEDKTKKKKKKQRLASKANKKDGFVRGMSVRG
jgi:hypothetical protein